MSLQLDQTAFLKQIRATPDDDTCRLVYADWLEEHGDPDQARFIRLQCEAERVRLHDPGAACDIDQQARDLAAARGSGWAEPLFEGGARRVHFRRGLPEEIEMDEVAFCARGQQLLRGAPPTVRRLKLTPSATVDRRTPVPEVLADSPEVGRLDGLDLSGYPLHESGVRTLVATRHFGGLAELVLDDCSLGSGGVGALAESRHFTALQRLSVAGNGVRASGISALVESPMAARLIELDISSNPIGDEGLHVLLSGSGRFPRLRHLTLQGYRSGDAPWGVTRQGLRELANGHFPPDMRLEFGGYRGSFADFRRHAGWFTRFTNYGTVGDHLGR